MKFHPSLYNTSFFFSHFTSFQKGHDVLWYERAVRNLIPSLSCKIKPSQIKQWSKVKLSKLVPSPWRGGHSSHYLRHWSVEWRPWLCCWLIDQAGTLQEEDNEGSNALCVLAHVPAFIWVTFNDQSFWLQLDAAWLNLSSLPLSHFPLHPDKSFFTTCTLPHPHFLTMTIIIMRAAIA